MKWSFWEEFNLSIASFFPFLNAAYTQNFRDNGEAIVNIIADMHRGMPMMPYSGAARAGVENLTKYV